MGDWTLLHTRSPLNTSGAGTGQYGEITKASSRKFGFSADDHDTLSFDMPGGHPQTAAIVPLVSDVLAFRDEESVQRFRVVSRVLTKESGVLKASFAAVSYQELLAAWIFHTTDVRSWTAEVEQTALAWTILTQGQARALGDLGITRGTLPATPVTRVLTGSVAEGGTKPEYFMVGMKRREAIDNLAAMVNGFEWDIQPDPVDPYRRLKFNTWNTGLRNQHAVTSDNPTGRSPLVLDDGGSMASWSHTVTPTEYANVIRYTGSETTAENSEGTTTTIDAAWQPTTQDPATPAPEGRWERDLNNGDLTTQAAVNAYAPGAYDQAHIYVPETTCTLRRGRWTGPQQLWLGDKARLIITEPVVGPQTGGEDYIVYIDEDVRVVEIGIDVDDLGGEDISLSLNRPRFSTKRNTRTTNDRLRRLERR